MNSPGAIPVKQHGRRPAVERSPLPPALRAELVRGLARLVLLDLEQQPALPAVTAEPARANVTARQREEAG